MARDLYLHALRVAAAPALERIRRDRKRAPLALKKVFTIVARDLFREKLTASLVWSRAEIRDHRLHAVFRDVTDCSLKAYIDEARIEVAELLLHTSDLDLGTIGGLIGYSYHATFIDAFGRVKEGARPSEVPRLPPRRSLIDVATSVRAGRGELDDAEAVAYHEQFLRIYPHVAERLQASAEPAPEPRIEVDDARTDHLIAEGLWQGIRGLPFEEQRREVRRYRFHSTVLFDLLRQNSRQEGREDRQRGIEIAELALVSLERSDEIFGDRIHDLRALGWAWLGNAYRLALDFVEADRALERGDSAWRQPGAPHGSLVAAEIRFLKGTLRMSQRNYPEALELIEEARDMFRIESDLHGESKALTQRGLVYLFAEEPLEAIAAFKDANGLLGDHGDPFLAYSVYCNLANAQAKSGLYRAASESLNKCSEFKNCFDSPLESLKIFWVDAVIKHGVGDLDAAERLFRLARSGYSEAHDLSNFAIISLDLAMLLSEDERWQEAMSLALEAVPILESVRLYPETLTAVSLLSQALESRDVSSLLLRNVRDALNRDPLTGLDGVLRTREIPGPQS